MNKSTLGYLLAITASFLFGLSTPINKLLLGEINPVVLSGWSYLFSGLLLLPSLKYAKKETTLKKSDVPKLSLIILFGSVLGPIFVLFGLSQATAYQSSLFLNFEMIFTVSIAILVFKEEITWRALLGIIIMIVILLAWSVDFQLLTPIELFNFALLFILLGTLFWAMDNNITRTLEDRSSLQITMIKSLFGGVISLIIALILRAQVILSLIQFLIVLLVGFLTFGVSIACFTASLRYIGTIKTSVILSLSPFIGAALSLMIFLQMPSILDLLAFIIALVGVILIVSEKSESIHIHHFLIHSHVIDITDPHHERVKIIKREGENIVHVHEKLKHSHRKPHDDKHVKKIESNKE